MKFLLLSFSLLTLISTHYYFSSNAQAINTSAELISVTVYTYGAEVVNKFATHLPQDNSEIIIGNVANNLEPSTIQKFTVKYPKIIL